MGIILTHVWKDQAARAFNKLVTLVFTIATTQTLTILYRLTLFFDVSQKVIYEYKTHGKTGMMYDDNERWN